MLYVFMPACLSAKLKEYCFAVFQSSVVIICIRLSGRYLTVALPLDPILGTIVL